MQLFVSMEAVLNTSLDVCEYGVIGTILIYIFTKNIYSYSLMFSQNLKLILKFSLFKLDVNHFLISTFMLFFYSIYFYCLILDMP